MSKEKKGFFDKLSEALGGGGDFASEYEDHGYNGHARPTAGEASAARKRNKANTKFSDEEIGQLITGKHVWEFFDLEFEKNEVFRKHVIDLAYETGAIEAYNPDPLNGFDVFWVISDKAHTRFSTEKEAKIAQLKLHKPLREIDRQIWHVDEEGNPTTMATEAESEAYEAALLEAELDEDDQDEGDSNPKGSAASAD